MRNALISDEPDPLVDLNTTPLIDVMLVLIVMFIITIPIQTHAVKLDLPAPCRECPIPHGDVNVVTVNPADQLAWNNVPISTADLALMLRQTQQMQPEPELHLRPDGAARYGAVDEVLAIIKREHVQKFGFVGNETDRDVF